MGGRRSISPYQDWHRTPSERMMINGFPPAFPGGGSFVPTDIAGLNPWYRAVMESYADNDPVGTATDQSGSTNNSAATGTARPTFKTNLKNSKPGYRFNGTSTVMNLASGVSGAVPFSAFVVYRKTITGVIVVPFGCSSQPFPYPLYDGDHLYISSDQKYGRADGENTAFVVATIVVPDNTHHHLWLDGVPQSITEFDAAGVSSGLINLFGGILTDKSNGDILEAGFYEGVALTDPQRESVEDYLGDPVTGYDIPITH